MTITMDFSAEQIQKDLIDCLQSDQHKIRFAVQLCEKLKRKQFTLEQTIVLLGSYLTSTDRIQQLKAIDFLHCLSAQASSDTFSQTEVNFMVEFFAKRLSDNFLIPESIVQTLFLFVKQWNIPAEIACNLISTIFKNVEINQQSTEIRFTFYQMVGILLQRHLIQLQQLKHNFVQGFLQMIEGEKDPRCLLITFELHHQVTKHFPLTPFEEEMFEVVCCYFPISYNPPKEKNTLNITRDDLSQALQTCLQSRAEFASFLLPFLIEKLESPAEHVKIDCYRLLHSVCDLYTCNDFAAHYVELWTTIKADALIGGDSPVQTLARSLPQHIARAMLRSVKNDLFIKFIALLRSELEPCLANPLLNCFHTASVVCSHLAVIPSLFAEITLMLTKHFVDQLAVIDDMPSERVIELMKSIDSYCECVAELDWKSLQKNSDGEAFDSIDQLFSALADWMANYSGKRNEFQAYLKAFQRCMSLEVIRPSQECLDVIAHKTVAILALSFQVAPDDRICEELMLQVFATFVRRFPVHAHFHMYPFILRRLNEADWQHSIGILHAVQLCSLDPSQLDRFTNFALTILIRREQVFERVQQAVVDVIRSMRARYPLAQLFEMYVKMVVEALNYLYLTQQADCESGRYLFEAISLIAPYVPVDRGGIAVLRFFVDILYLRTPSDPHLLSETSVELRFDLPQFRTINIFDGSHRQVLFVGLLHASLVRLEFPFNLQLIEQLIDRIRHLLFNSYFVHDHHRRRSDQATLELLESVTAKFVHNPDFERFLLDDQLDELYQEHRETQIVSKCSTFIHIFRSIAKALLHVNHSRAEASLDHLAGLFLLTREPELLFRLVSSFEHAITPADHLTKTAHVLNATEFVVQRFFYSFLPRLLRIYNNLDELLNRTRQLYESTRNERVKRQTLSNMDGIQLATESISLNQVGRIVQAIENRIHSDSTVGSKVQTVTAANDLSTVSQDHIERLNLLRVCLSHCILMPLRFLPNAIVRNELLRLRKFFDQIMLNSQANQPTTFMLTQLHCIRLLFELNPGHLLPQLVAVIHFLTKHLQSSKQAIRVKCLILDCLTLIARTCPEIELLKMRREVICALEPTLDDPKRVVRYASVRTNCRWVLIGQPS